MISKLKKIDIKTTKSLLKYNNMKPNQILQGIVDLLCGLESFEDLEMDNPVAQAYRHLLPHHLETRYRTGLQISEIV